MNLGGKHAESGGFANGCLLFLTVTLPAADRYTELPERRHCAAAALRARPGPPII